MATMSDHPELSPQSELDKLGPLGARGTILRRDGELRVALIEELVSASEAARDAALSTDTNAATAVHEYRKALRRARAILSLVGCALPKDERRAVRRALQEARRALSAVRDHAVAPETLAALPLGDDDRATANQVIAQAAEAMPPASEIKQRLAEGAGRTAAQVEALEAALPQVLELDTLVDGVREVYGEARKARKRAKAKASDSADFHRMRRRTKELTYQLDLLARWAGPRTEKLHDRFDRVADDMSSAVDRIMLCHFVETYGHGIAPARLDPLLAAITDELDDAMKTALRASKRAFRDTGKQLAKRLARAIEKDVDPGRPHDADGAA